MVGRGFMEARAARVVQPGAGQHKIFLPSLEPRRITGHRAPGPRPASALPAPRASGPCLPNRWPPAPAAPDSCYPRCQACPAQNPPGPPISVAPVAWMKDFIPPALQPVRSDGDSPSVPDAAAFNVLVLDVLAGSMGRPLTGRGVWGHRWEEAGGGGSGGDRWVNERAVTILCWRGKADGWVGGGWVLLSSRCPRSSLTKARATGHAPSSLRPRVWISPASCMISTPHHSLLVPSSCSAGSTFDLLRGIVQLMGSPSMADPADPSSCVWRKPVLPPAASNGAARAAPGTEPIIGVPPCPPQKAHWTARLSARDRSVCGRAGGM